MKKINIRNAKFGLVLFLSIIGIIYILRKTNYIDVDEIISYFGNGAAYVSLPLFMAFFIIAVAVAIPVTALTIGAGYVFGFQIGFMLSIVGATVGALLAFLLSRYLFHNYFHKKLAHSKWLSWSKIKDQRTLTRIVLFSRALPFIPFNVVNYVFGLTKVKANRYFIATFIGMIPEVILFSYLGDSLKEGLSPRLIAVFAAIVVLTIIGYLIERKIHFRESVKKH